MKRISELIHSDKTSIDHYQLYSPNFINFADNESMEFIFNEIYEDINILHPTDIIDLNAKRCDLGFFIDLKSKGDYQYHALTDEFYLDIIKSKYSDVSVHTNISIHTDIQYTLGSIKPNIVIAGIFNDLKYTNSIDGYQNIQNIYDQILNLISRYIPTRNVNSILILPYIYMDSIKDYINQNPLINQEKFKITIYKSTNLIKIVL